MRRPAGRARREVVGISKDERVDRPRRRRRRERERRAGAQQQADKNNAGAYHLACQPL